MQVRPIAGTVPVERFYGYRLPRKYASEANGASVGNTAYVSTGTADLQRPNASVAFLYRGPRGLSLVVVHGSVRHSEGGAATFRITGLPETGEWVVRDDFYRDPETGGQAASNFDRWRVDGSVHAIDWTWGATATDGGAFRGLGDEFEVVVRPAFNEAATLYGVYYDGKITDWQFLSGASESPRRISLDLGQPIRIRTGECGGRGN